MTASWLSLHAFVGSHQDAYLVNVDRLRIDLLRKESLENFFYLRYWDGGPHLRLRFLPSRLVAREEFDAEVTEALQDCLPAIPALSEAEVGAYERMVASFAKMEDMPQASTSRLRLQSGLETHVYSPEFAKYAGTKGMDIAHALWRDSTAIALNLIGESNRPKRLGAGMAMLVTALRGFHFDRKYAVEWLNRYGAYWRGYANSPAISAAVVEKQATIVGDYLRSVWKGEAAPSHAGQQWLHALHRAESQIAASEVELGVELSSALGGRLEAKAYLLMQYVHTHNNRLGMTPADEYYISSVAAEALARDGSVDD